jgi:hypothetical protein
VAVAAGVLPDAVKIKKEKRGRKKHFNATYILYLRPIDVEKIFLLYNIVRRGDIFREQKIYFR